MMFKCKYPSNKIKMRYFRLTGLNPQRIKKKKKTIIIIILRYFLITDADTQPLLFASGFSHSPSPNRFIICHAIFVTHTHALCLRTHCQFDILSCDNSVRTLQDGNDI